MFTAALTPPETPTSMLLLAAFSRWNIERTFEDCEGELGMDHRRL